MEVVGAGFCGDEDGGSGARAVLSGVVISQDLKFLNVVDRGKGADTAGRQFVVVDAIEKPIGAIGTGAADGERERAACGDLAVSAAGEKAVGVGLGGSASGKSGELNEIAAVERKLGNFLGSDDLPERGIGSFDGDGGGIDFHSRGNRRWRERKVQFARFIDLQTQVPVFDGLKTLKFDAERVDGNGKQGDEVVTSVIGFRFARDTGGLRDGGDRRAGDGRAGFVQDRA